MSALSAANSPTDRDILVGILGSHPRLGQPKTAAAGGSAEHLSELSKKEQANLNTGAAEQAEKLRALNAEYEKKFPGLRFVYVLLVLLYGLFITGLLIVLLHGNRTFVNNRSRDVIMEEMRQRIDRGDFEKETEEVIQVSHLNIAFPDSVETFLSRGRPCVISPKAGLGSWYSRAADPDKDAWTGASRRS